MKKNSDTLHNIILVLCVIVFLICFSMLFNWYLDSKNADKDIKEIKTTIITNDDNSSKSNKNTTNIENCVAWIEIPDTDIDYPVMQKKNDPEYYLRRNYKGEYSYSGTPFLDSKCNIGTSQNLIVYGHNMKDGTMFSGLMKYKDTEYSKQHPTIYLTVDNTAYEYELYAVCKVFSDDGWYTFTERTSEETFDELISHIQNKSLYKSDKTAEYEDYFLTLSTCEYSQENGRLIAIAKRR